ncbi:unnamed protein product [Arabis nemorensis]|uniref:MATH domain-containing protein n=1 Tax=Arabis nemorensis TaxID=586526 RepID=A0A565AZ05_9BRAS|nr:unnamed protein product [Arabis nemorensis]
MAGLAASPGFIDWLIEQSDRIKLLPPTKSYDDEFGSESDSTGEQLSWTVSTPGFTSHMSLRILIKSLRDCFAFPHMIFPRHLIARLWVEMGSCLEAVSTIVQNWRDHPPSSFSLKIQNFSQLEKSTAFSDHKYQSRLFSSGGHNWRLVVYPKGNEKDSGNGFISMYVEIDGKCLMIFTPPTEVFAELRFFVYNKKQNKYLMIQDVEAKRFNALKTVWGLPQVVPYDTFNNPENGYIFKGDQCEFGVDVIVAPPLTNWEIVSYNQKLPNPKFAWTLKNFSELKENEYKSKSFSMGGRNWFLKLYPKGDSRADGKWLSVFLKLADGEKPKADEKFFVQANLRVLDPLGSNHSACKMNDWYNDLHTGWGWIQFLSLDELRKSYLDKADALNVEVEFEVVSAAKYSPIV